MIAAVGDLVEDIVVRCLASVAFASDTPSVIRRRQGGSAANVCVAARRLGVPARFIGQLGDDRSGETLAADLLAEGVELVGRRAGRSAAIVVLLDERGERTMLTDTGSSRELSDPEPHWLDGVTWLHVPFYSLVDEPLASTALVLAAWASQRGVPVSVDASSSAVIRSVGAQAAVDRIVEVDPVVVLANGDEAAAFGAAWSGVCVGRAAIVKHGAEPAQVVEDAEAHTVAALPLDDVDDTTGAGDAFAAGVIAARLGGRSWDDAVRGGHASAAAHLTRQSRRP